MRLFFALFFVFVSASVSLAQNSFLTGKWMSVEGTDTSYMIFDKEEYITFLIYDPELGDFISFGGKKFLRDDGVFVDFKYKTDTLKTPYVLDLMVYKTGTDTLLSIMPGIYTSIGYNTIKVNIGEALGAAGRPMTPQELKKASLMRPKDFDAQSTVLGRVK